MAYSASPSSRCEQNKIRYLTIVLHNHISQRFICKSIRLQIYCLPYEGRREGGRGHNIIIIINNKIKPMYSFHGVGGSYDSQYNSSIIMVIVLQSIIQYYIVLQSVLYSICVSYVMQYMVIILYDYNCLVLSISRISSIFRKNLQYHHITSYSISYHNTA